MGAISTWQQFWALAKGEAILVEILAIKGSTPRDMDAKMVVSASEMFGTIGGGQAEYMMMDEARKMLRQGQDHREIDLPLGPQIGQCCGGHFTFSLRRLDARAAQIFEQSLRSEADARTPIYIFGAGHVGRALAQALKPLPFRPILIDQRAEELSKIDNIEKRLSPLPEAELRVAPDGAGVVVVTHDHALDFMIAGEALAMNRFFYVGMIGSKSKRNTFRSWLADAYSDASFDQLVLPIGGAKVKDKRPEVIAALVAAELIEQQAANAQNAKVNLGGEYAR
ncbi:xanthine dehydrogenase accessory protein XdhC [Maritalea myrionectae]|uniref:xanthine dehydrogenase accessory protein XdhC n=1 Tax=Maritalea myrionectae TaxID=454601 RepID=UPI0004135871|nr:xanthine dehydrogenase accessory protein XdhC [Maritalea myrionectae]